MFDFSESDGMIAIRDMDGTVSYSELERASGILAGILVNSLKHSTDTEPGAASETVRVSLILPRNRFYPIAVVATLKAGMAFQPIGNDNPDKRIAEIIHEVRPGAVITTAEEYDRHKAVLNGCNVILIDRLDFTAPCTFTCRSVPPDTDAMIIFTSGSSGTPKGVIHTRRSLLANTVFKLLPEEGKIRKTAAVLDFAFIVSNIDIISCLLGHGELHIPDKSITHDIKALSAYCSDNGITRVATTTKMAAMLSGLDDPGIPVIAFGGSRASGILPNRRTRFGMGYGSTESGFSTMRFLDDEKDMSDIGVPYDDVEVFVLDEHLNEVQEGEDGEIYVCSPRIARAYLNDDELTAEKFIASPFRKGCTMFRTGDIGRRGKDGKCSLIGRSDRMIKHNAYRIQPEEVETIAETSEGVDSARLIDRSGTLILYYEGRCKESVLLENLQASLPSHMIPGKIVRLDRMPVTGYGKTDSRALEAMEVDDIENRVVKAMEHVLRTDGIDLDDDFFRLGGDSVGIMELTLLLEGINLKAEDVYLGRSARGIASVIREKCADHEDRGQAVSWPEVIPLVQFQQYVLETNSAFTGGTMWNTPLLYRIDGDYQLQDIIQAIEKVIVAHPLLGCRYDEKAGMLRHDPDIKPQISILDTCGSSPEVYASSLIREFDLHDAPLYRICLLVSRSSTYLFLDFHHLITDGASILVFVNQIRMVLDGLELRPDRFWEFAQAHCHTGIILSGHKEKPVPEICKAHVNCTHACGRALTALCIAAAARALSRSTGAGTPEISWISHNRTEARYADSFGPMLSRHAISVDTSLDRDTLVSQITHCLEEPPKSGQREFAAMDTWGIEVNNLFMIDNISGFSRIPMEIPEPGVDPGAISLLLIPERNGIRVQMEYDSCRHEKKETERYWQTFLSEFKKLLK